MTVQAKPTLNLNLNCRRCQKSLQVSEILWQGINVCVKSKCFVCNIDMISSLPVGHTVYRPFQIDLKSDFVRDDKESTKWISAPLLKSLQKPQIESLAIEREILQKSNRVIILNCLDCLYGHCLLKLLNAQRHLENQPEYGLVVIIQPFLRWMVPDGVAEIWTIDLPLRKGQLYYPSLNEFIQSELQRFDEIQISEAYSHPSAFDITKFTRVEQYSFDKAQLNITFIWREDRLWCNPLFERRRTLKIMRLEKAVLWLQNWRICKLFKLIRLAIPEATFTVTGLGKRTRFPEKIKDARVEKFDAVSERETCQLYADSLLVIGVHGSNMLLPSAHAGMTIDLMPKDRWENFAQDIIYRKELDPKSSSFFYRYLPLKTSLSDISRNAISMILKREEFLRDMTSDLQ